jgi:hypothetical protein
MVVDDGILSLVTVGLFMNATTMNQGNHCIITFNQTRPAIDNGNEALASNQDRCASLEESLQPALRNLAEMMFNQAAMSSFGRLVSA